MNDLQGLSGEKGLSSSARSLEKRDSATSGMVIDIESLDSDSDTDRALEELVGPWKSTGAVAKRTREIENSPEEEEGEPSEKAVAVEPQPAVTTKIKAGRGANIGHKNAKTRVKELKKMSSFEAETDAVSTYRLTPPQTRSQTRILKASGETRESNPINMAETSPETVAECVPSREELIDKARSAVSSIMNETEKSSNLKSDVRGEINRATKEIHMAMDALQAMSIDEEARRLRADNKRMRQEMATLRAEVAALRSSFSAKEKPQVDQLSLIAESQISATLVEMLETLKRDLFISIGGMVNDRLGEIEKRLPQEPILRPPLAADRNREKAARRPVDEPSAGPSPARSPKRTGTKNKVASASRAQHSTQSAGTLPQGTEGAEPTIPTPPAWSKVVGRKTKAAKANGDKSAVLARAPAKTATVKIITPKSSAIVITLKPEAVAKQTYASVMKKAASALPLKDVGVDHVRVRKTATGARLIEVPGAGSTKAADELAGRLQGLVGEWVTVSRPMKTANLRLVGLDESITLEEVQRVVAEKGSVPLEQVRPGAIRLGSNGMGSILVRCPVTAAKVLNAAGKVVIGWSSVRVTLLEPLPMRCFKCLGTGHTRVLCPSPLDRSTLCFRCGEDGHRAASCSASPKCAICSQIGRKAEHVMGGLKCCPPPTRGKEPILTQASESSRRPEETQEEVEMDS